MRERKDGELEGQYSVFVPKDEVRPTAALVAWPLQPADRENRLKEQKSGWGLEKLPTGRFHAHWASLLIGQRAVNLLAGFKRLLLPPFRAMARS